MSLYQWLLSVSKLRQSCTRTSLDQPVKWRTRYPAPRSTKTCSRPSCQEKRRLTPWQRFSPKRPISTRSSMTQLNKSRIEWPRLKKFKPSSKPLTPKLQPSNFTGDSLSKNLCLKINLTKSLSRSKNIKMLLRDSLRKKLV